MRAPATPRGVARGPYVALTVILASSHSMPLCAQTPSTVVGVVGGHTVSEQNWSSPSEADEIGGYLAGAFADVTTPLSWLSIRLEAAYTQRGGSVVDAAAVPPVSAAIRSDYLAIALQARAALPLGPARLQVSAGPISDLLIRSRLDPTLAQLLLEEGVSVFGLRAGVGIGVWITENVFVEVEARIVKQMRDAYSGDFISVRYRSRELVARVGTPVRLP